MDFKFPGIKPLKTKDTIYRIVNGIFCSLKQIFYYPFFEISSLNYFCLINLKVWFLSPLVTFTK